MSSFVGNALQGDFGYSFIRHKPAYEVITERLPATIKLAAVAFVLSIVFSIPFGVLSATRAHTPIDYAVTVMALAGQSIPSFWLGILLILLLGVDLKWLPISGSGSWQHFIMPAITLSAFSIARNMRLTRSSMLDYMQKDFVRTARSKGLPENRVIYGHVLRNSMLPIVTAIGLEIGFLLGGSVIVETIFGWPGVGREIVAAHRLQGFLRRAGRRHHAGADLRRSESDDRPDLHVDRSRASAMETDRGRTAIEMPGT